jgi:precorrin-4/cobalt-precorrin-4 C11-methyltransferase
VAQVKVFFVGAGPGSPDLITLRGKAVMERCRVCVYAGSLVNPELLEFLPEGAEVHDSSGMSLEDLEEVYRNARERGLDVARLQTGDFSIYSALHEQVRLLAALGIQFEVVPGVSSFQAAAASLRRELTAPEITQTVILTRAAGKTPVPERERIAALARTGATLCIFLSVRMIDRIVADILPHYGEETPAAVVYRASWPDERVIEGTLGTISELVGNAGIERTALIVVGPVLRDHGTKSRLYDSSFSHGFREADDRDQT